MKIYIGSDHAGYGLKEIVKEYLLGLELGHEIAEKGAFAYEPEDDYPDFVRPVAEAVAAEAGSFGVVFGGGGQGEAVCANRVPGVRAMAFYGPKEPISTVDIQGRASADPYEQIILARAHNDANIISIAARFVSEDEAKFAIELFLATKFSGDERHERRIKKIDQK